MVYISYYRRLKIVCFLGPLLYPNPLKGDRAQMKYTVVLVLSHSKNPQNCVPIDESGFAVFPCKPTIYKFSKTKMDETATCLRSFLTKQCSQFFRNSCNFKRNISSCFYFPGIMINVGILKLKAITSVNLKAHNNGSSMPLKPVASISTFPLRIPIIVRIDSS